MNAWNEWAEGTHLEPDLHFGHRWLEATRNALDSWLLTDS
ncbi:MAG: glycoside hydrolase family 99-like domain-containing protein [Planktothrix sp.]